VSKLSRLSIVGLLFVYILVLASVPTSAVEPVKLVINGETVECDVAPLIVDGRTLVPVRVVSENLGATVTWHGDTRTVEITRGEDELLLAIGSNVATFNGQEVTMDVAAQIVNDRTMVPVRFVAETLGVRVSWDGETRTVYIEPFATPSLTDIRYEPSIGRGRLVLDVGAPVEYRHWFDTSVTGAPRLFIELDGTTMGLAQKAFFLGKGGITLVRAGVMGYRNPRIWVVFDLSEQFGIEVSESPDRTELWLDIKYRVDRVAYEKSSKGMVINVETTGEVPVEDTLSADGKQVTLFMPGIDLGDSVEPEVEVANPVVESIHTRAVDGGVSVEVDLASSIDSDDYTLEVWESAVQLFVHTPVEDIRWRREGTSYRIHVDATVPLAYKTFRLTNPDRIVIDIPNAVLSDGEYDEHVARTLLTRLRAGQFQEDPPVVRVVLEAPPKAALELQPATTGLELLVTPYRAGGLKIAIDPGHGGKDPGAVGPAGFREKDVNLAMSKKLVKALEDLGAEPVLLRTGDYYLGLYERPAMANDLNVDIFVSVHNNGFPDPTKGGTETYWYENHPLSRTLGAVVHEALVEATGLQDRGLRYANFAVLRETSMPSILLECAYMTNPREELLLQKPEFQQRLVDAVAEAIMLFFDTELSEADQLDGVVSQAPGE